MTELPSASETTRAVFDLINAPQDQVGDRIVDTLSDANHAGTVLLGLAFVAAGPIRKAIAKLNARAYPHVTDGEGNQVPDSEATRLAAVILTAAANDDIDTATALIQALITHGPRATGLAMADLLALARQVVRQEVTRDNDRITRMLKIMEN